MQISTAQLAQVESAERVRQVRAEFTRHDKNEGTDSFNPHGRKSLTNLWTSE